MLGAIMPVPDTRRSDSSSPLLIYFFQYLLITSIALYEVSKFMNFISISSVKSGSIGRKGISTLRNYPNRQNAKLLMLPESFPHCKVQEIGQFYSNLINISSHSSLGRIFSFTHLSSLSSIFSKALTKSLNVSKS